MKAITFKSNTWDGNFFTAGKSLIQLEGAPRVFFNSETFTSNGDMVKEAINQYGTLTASSEYTIANRINGGTSSQYLGRSLISIKRSQQVSLTAMTYDSNWKLETDYGSRSQLIYIDEFYGKFDIGSLTVKNHVGINNAFVT